ncbi:MAG: FAD-binding oxidoreductase [Myxococcales bacterium]|nr:FAD-binding oxidoreductase [Myxococcales bacterium]
MAERKFWGWGVEGAGPNDEQAAAIARGVEARFGCSLPEAIPAPKVSELDLRAPRVTVPSALSAICVDDPRERAAHHWGRGFRDVVRALRREFPNPPDWVAYPTREDDIVALLDWCAERNLAAVPFGGGSSVVGGVEMPGPQNGNYAGAISIDMTRMRRVLEVDRTSRAARIEAGVLGPDLEAQLRPHGLTLRHFPQSFEFSSLGGWIATRSGGHFATVYTHIEDLLESTRVVTPSGIAESRRLPGSGAGPSPDRMFAGSEGTLGIIVEAWMRLQDRPTFRANAAVRFTGDDGFVRGAEAVRLVSQTGLFPTNTRILDAIEAKNAGAGDGSCSVLILGFESADHPTEAKLKRAVEVCRDAGGLVDDEELQSEATASNAESGKVTRAGAAGAWRKAFIEMPYVRDVLLQRSLVLDTFETAITWDRFPEFHRAVMTATQQAVDKICGGGTVTCRFTHVYPDGPAPYYSVTAPGKRGGELEQWDEIKAAAAEAVISGGGTITHHHAVGRDHRPWYDRQRPDLFERALRAAKRELDPRAILNPGVLFDPEVVS